MAVDLQPYKIGIDDKNYPTKHNSALDHMESEINSGLNQITANLNTLSDQITSEIDTATGTLSLQITGELQAAVEVVEGYRDQTAVSATTATTQAGIATTKANETVSTASLAEGYKDSSLTNAQAAAAAAASISDVAARVQQVSIERGLDHIRDIHISFYEGWELKGTREYMNDDRPSGRMLGDYSDAVAAWAANKDGVATVAGDYYVDSDNGAAYECTTEDNSDRVFRTGSAHFPKARAIVLSDAGTSTRLTIYDLTDPLMPIWKEWQAVAYGILSATSSPENINLVDIAWYKGKLAIASYDSSGRGVYILDFDKDEAVIINDTTLGQTKLLNASFSSAKWRTIGAGWGGSSLDGQVLRVAFDEEGNLSATTRGGVVVISPDYSFVYGGDSETYRDTAILNGRLYAINSDEEPEAVHDFGDINGLSDSFARINRYALNETPKLSLHTIFDMASGDNSLLLSDRSIGINQLWPNPAEPQNSLVAKRGINFATPPMKKAELAIACGTFVGTYSAAGGYVSDFTAGVDGWEALNNVYVTWDAVNERLVIDRDSGLGSATGFARKAGILEVGKLYFVTMEIESGPGAMRYDIYGVIEGPVAGYYSGSGTRTWLIQATSEDLNLILTNSYGDCGFGSVIVQEVIADFSGHGRHASIYGSLTASALAIGGVAGLSGYSTSDYVEAYNLWDGIGTGEGWLAGAFKCPTSAVSERLLHISYHDGADYLDSGVSLYLDGPSGQLQARFSEDGFGTSAELDTISNYDDEELHTFVIRKTASHYIMSIDGEEAARTPISTFGDLQFNASAKMYVGVVGSLAAGAPNATIWFPCGGKVALSDAEEKLIHMHMRNQILNQAALSENPYSLDYDPTTKTYHMAGDTYHQALCDGAILSSEEHGQGDDAIIGSGIDGTIVIGAATLEITTPEKNLRDRPLTLVPERKTVTYEGNATGSRVLFPDPTNDAEVAEVIGWRPVLVYDDGVGQTKGAADDYTIADYGLGRYCAEFATEPADGNNVDIVFEREVWK